MYQVLEQEFAHLLTSWVVSIYSTIDFFHPRFVFSPLFACLFIPTWTYRYLVFTPGHSPVLLICQSSLRFFHNILLKIRINFLPNQIFLLVGFLLKSLKLWPLEVCSVAFLCPLTYFLPILRLAISPKDLQTAFLECYEHQILVLSERLFLDSVFLWNFLFFFCVCDTTVFKSFYRKQCS